jgi:hypothetical protein
MEGKKEGPEKPGKTQLEEIREMLGHILLRQAEDRQTNKERLDEILHQQRTDREEILRRMEGFQQQTAKRLDILEQRAEQDKAEMHKELRKQEKGLGAVAASQKQISTEQMARILHVENSTASTKEQVLAQGKMQERIGKETKIL